MPVELVLSGYGCKPVKIWTDKVEKSAEDQLRSLSKLPFVHKHIAVMPDVHAGIGSTVGSVIATKKAIIPAAVGVDIGCGMMAQKLAITADQLPDNLAGLRSAIEAAVPHGRSNNGGMGDKGAWGGTPTPTVVERSAGILFSDPRWKSLLSAHPEFGSSRINKVNHLGTLGTGNHFIELCVEHDGPGVWVMLHSGSRGIGSKIGSYFIDKAKEEMGRWHVKLEDPNLAYLPAHTSLFGDYWSALSWAQDYAKRNREIMMVRTLNAISAALGMFLFDAKQPTAVNCHHNYASLENHFGENVYVTRKGAVRARQGDMGIIPGSMGAKSFIVRGKGNPESFCSCSHGAGRTMSRTEAKKRFSVDDLKLQTLNVECRKDADVIDEIPGAYKNIDEVMAHQSDLVEVVATLKQVLCVKG